jgi:hypothetical protein
MHIVGTPQAHVQPATAEEVADLELGGTWVVDVRRGPRTVERTGWLLEWEDDIVFLTDDPQATADETSELVLPVAAWPLDAA